MHYVGRETEAVEGYEAAAVEEEDDWGVRVVWGAGVDVYSQGEGGGSFEDVGLFCCHFGCFPCSLLGEKEEEKLGLKVEGMEGGGISASLKCARVERTGASFTAPIRFPELLITGSHVFSLAALQLVLFVSARVDIPSIKESRAISPPPRATTLNLNP